MPKQSIEVGDVFDIGEIVIQCELTATGPVYTANAGGMEASGKRISHALRGVADMLSLMPSKDNPIGDAAASGSFAHVGNFDPVTGQVLRGDMTAICATPIELFEQFERASVDAFSAMSAIEKSEVEKNQAMLLGALHACMRMMISQKMTGSEGDDKSVLGPTPRMMPIVLELLRRMRRSDPATVRSYARSFVDEVTELVAHKMEKGAEC